VLLLFIESEVNTMTQGERVHEIRKSLNLTLEKFGEKLGVGKTAIFKIEKSENSLTDQMVRSICREYNVSYDYLINGEGEIFDDLPQTVLDELCTQYDLSDFDRMLVEMYVELPKELREQAENCIKKFLEKKNKKSEDV
jgi:transcriptional regulator with XRE-family HTH domain